MNTRSLTVALALLLTTWCAVVAAQPGPIVLEGGTVHTASGAVLDPGVVVLDPKTGRITSVGTTAPPGGTRVDCRGKQVTPGLIAIDTQLGLLEIGAVAGTRDADAGGKDPIRAAFRASDGFNPSSVAIPVTRPGGITSALIVPSGGLISGQSAWIDLRGAGRGSHARLVRDTVALHVLLGEQGAEQVGAARGAAALRLRELFDDVALYRKSGRQYTQRALRDLSASRLDLEALKLAQDASRPTFWRADRASDILMALRLSKAFGLTPIITHAAEAWRVIDALKEANATVVLDPLSNLPTSFSSLGARADTAALLHEAGVPVVITASYFNTHNARNLRYVAGNAVRAGLPRDAALRAVTLAAAAAVGMDKDYGSLDPGKVANVAVWSGDPFEFATEVEQLYVQGQRVSLDNRQEQLYERYRQLPRRAPPLAPGEDD